MEFENIKDTTEELRSYLYSNWDAFGMFLCCIIAGMVDRMR